MKMITSVSRYLRFLVICTIYYQFTQVQNSLPQVDALLYHQFQPPPPLLSRINRQPQQALTHSNYNGNSLYNLSQAEQNYYMNNDDNNQYNSASNRQQQRINYLVSTIASTRDTRGPSHEQQHQQKSYQRDQTILHDPVPIIATDTPPSSQLDSFGCPSECHCNEIAQIADCSNRNLTRVPSNFPKDIKRIRLERNNITDIGPYAFRGLRRLQRIDLSNNNLQRIDALAFSDGLESLISLILYSNKLEYLPANLFNELSQLQLLLLNANSLQTIHKDLFQDLENLNLLSLYDNNIETLPSGSFDGLKSIKTIHLGKNPLNCDCNLRWLAEFLEANRVVETSEARCDGPKNSRVQGKKLSQLSRTEFRCSELQASPPAKSGHQQQQAQIADAANACPIGCVCSGATVDCSRSSSAVSQEQRTNGAQQPAQANGAGGLYELPDIPDDVPVYVARVHINDQRIKRIRQTGLFRRLANSQKLDLGNNKIIDIEDNAINGQFSNGQKAERVVFVLLENQHCTAAPGSSVEGPPIPLDACASAPKVNEPQFDSPCYNGGTCKSTTQATGANSSASTALNYSCVCPAGFAGPLCEINIDDCVEHQCQNGAMCVDGVNSYKCVCRDPTTSGEFCEQLATSSSAPAQSLSFPYASTSSAALSTLPLVAPPLALPIISSGNNQQQQQQSVELSPARHNGQQAQQSGSNQQILARSADFARVPAQEQQIIANQASHADASGQLEPPNNGRPSAMTGGGGGGGGSCQRVTQRSYFDDGNGCQSVRLLKLSTCAGLCGGTGGLSGCCQPVRVKRRRIRMQCNDGASYVKTIDLVKKCACSSDGEQCAPGAPQMLGTKQSEPFDETAASSRHDTDKTKSTQYFKYLTSSAAAAAANRNHRYQNEALSGASTSSGLHNDQTMQITRLDAVD